MQKTYVMLQDDITHLFVFREDYGKVIKNMAPFEEGTAPEGWYEFVTTNSRPEIPQGKYLCHQYEIGDGVLYRTYVLIDSKDDIRLYNVKDYEDAVQNFLDESVRVRGYDNIYTCISYKGDPDPIFSAEADQALAWRSTVWRTAQGILNRWISGEIPQPTISEVLRQLPQLGWDQQSDSSD